MRPELVMFDCDGVLVDSEGASTEVMAAFFRSYGADIEARDVHALFVGGTLRSAGELMIERGCALPGGWFDDLVGRVVDRMAQGVPVVPGVVDLLDRLDAADFATAIVSNGSDAKMQASLGPSGLYARFEGRIFSGYTRPPKPSPAMIFDAMAQAGASAERSVMIDDSAPGCRSGVAAGVRTLGFAVEGQGADLAAVGAEVVTSMADVARVIGL